ncbi:hypothetical protein Tco_0777142 [Tanacetum coccineum]
MVSIHVTTTFISTSINPHSLEYAPQATTYHCNNLSIILDSSLVVPVFQKGADPIEQLSHDVILNLLLSHSGEGSLLQSSALSPRGKRDEHGSTIKVWLVSRLQASGQALTVEDNRFLCRDPGLHVIQTLRHQDCSHGQSSRNGSMLTETKTDITSDSNIIPYSQYLSEAQQETIQNSNSSAHQDVVKERTTATAITEGTWGFEHTKACFRDEIIPFIKELKDIFNNFNQYLVEELADVQKVFYQMEQAVEQHRLESRTFEVKMNQVLSENERLLAQAIDKDIVKTVVNLSVNASGETVNECQKCLELKTELLNKKDFVDKETYDKLCKSFTTLEKHCITLEADSQLNQEIFQQENSVLNQNALSFTQLFELSELRAQSQAKDTVIVKLKEQIKSLNGNVDESTVKIDMDEIETLNIELEHRVTKLVAENEHLKQTYKQLYDSIKPKRVQSKEQCDALIKQVNIKSGEISDLNAKLQEQGLVIAALKNELRKLKGKALDNEDTVTHSVDPKVSKDNMEPITPKLLNKRTAHSSYIKHTQEEALVLRDIVEHVKANYPQDPLLESAFSAFPNPTAKSMEVLIKILLMPLSDKTILDSHCFIHELKKEMNDDLEYV